MHGRGVPLLACQAEGEKKNKAVCVLVREFGDHVMEEQDGQVCRVLRYNSLVVYLCVSVCATRLSGEKKKSGSNDTGLVSTVDHGTGQGKVFIIRGQSGVDSAHHLAGWPLGTWPHAFLPCADRSDWDWDPHPPHHRLPSKSSRDTGLVKASIDTCAGPPSQTQY